MDKILTVSIAAYNVENVLDKGLQSLIVPDEYMDRLEVIIVNDGSKDRTSDIAKEYVDKYPDTFRLIDKPNGGYGSTINESIKVATGKYYRLMDGDDWYLTENIPGYIEYLERCDSDIVITPYYEVYMPEEEYKFISAHKDMSADSVAIEVARLGESIAMHEMAVKTELMQQNNISITEHCFYTDTEYVIAPLLVANSISSYDKEIYCYQLGHDDNQSVGREGRKKHYEDAIKVSLNVAQMVTKYDKDNNGLGNLEGVITSRVNRVIGLAYVGLMLQDDSKQSKIKLKELDDTLKNNWPEVYKKSNHIKKVNLLRKTGFVTFGLIRKRV